MSLTPMPPATASRTPSAIVPLGEADIRELADFLAIQSNRKTEDVLRHLRWFILENPARDAAVPIGHGFRLPGGSLAGCLLHCPQKFRYQQVRVALLGASLFYVDALHRGAGGIIFLKYSQYARQTPLFCNSANADAAQLWRARGAQPIATSDQELFAAVRWSPLLEEAILRWSRISSLSRMAGAMLSPIVRSWKRLKLGSSDSGDLTPISSAAHVMEFISVAPVPYLTGLRDKEFIHWRYFSGNDGTVGVYAFRSARLPEPVLVTVNQRRRGRRGQIRCLHVLDVFPRVSPEDLVAIVASLVQRYREQVDVIVLRNFEPPRQEGLRKAGFVRRQFECANGWVLDRNKLLPSPDWYFVPADCDWLI